MVVNKKILDNWKIYKEHGDVIEIACLSGFSSVTISNALNNTHGKMSQEVFKAIDSFYSKRRSDLKKSLAQLQKQSSPTQ